MAGLHRLRILWLLIAYSIFDGSMNISPLVFHYRRAHTLTYVRNVWRNQNLWLGNLQHTVAKLLQIFQRTRKRTILSLKTLFLSLAFSVHGCQRKQFSFEGRKKCKWPLSYSVLPRKKKFPSHEKFAFHCGLVTFICDSIEKFAMDFGSEIMPTYRTSLLDQFSAGWSFFG